MNQSIYLSLTIAVRILTITKGAREVVVVDATGGSVADGKTARLFRCLATGGSTCIGPWVRGGTDRGSWKNRQKIEIFFVFVEEKERKIHPLRLFLK